MRTASEAVACGERGGGGGVRATTSAIGRAASGRSIFVYRLDEDVIISIFFESELSFSNINVFIIKNSSFQY